MTDRSVERVARASRLSESHGRTDGRTNEEATTNSAYVTSVTRAGGANLFDGIGERWPVVRTGERPEIPWDVRRAVYRRDGWRCKFCGNTWTDMQLDLDHIVPWSAGGPDAGYNLRTLCNPCNMSRSNYRGFGDGNHYLPVTWWCIDCHGREVDPYLNRPPLVRPAPERFEPHDRMTFAYCATCDINSYTEVAL